MKQVFQSNIFTIFIIVLLGGFLVFYDLDDRALWQDEAETACVSQTLSSDNLIPKGYDGLNYFSQQRGLEYDENYTWKLHPWFQFYLTASSFFFLEESTFSARFPFAVLGLATIILSYFLSLLIWKDSKTAWFTVIFFCISVSFLMLTRQARYYAPVFFFSTYACYGLFSSIKSKKLGLLHFGIATFLLFHSQYLFALVFWLISLVYAFSFHREKFKVLCTLIVLLSIPNLIFLKWLLVSPYGEGFELGIGFSKGLEQYPSYIFKYLISPIWLFVPLGLFLFRKNKIQWKDEEKPILFFLFLIIGNLMGLLLFGRLVFVRYLCGMIPFLFLIKGRFASWLTKIHVSIPIALIMILTFLSDFPKYLKEITTDNIGPIEGIVSYLEQSTTAKDKIGIGYGDLALKFYLPNKIYGGLVVDMPSNMDSLDIIVMRQNVITDRDYEVTLAFNDYFQLHQNDFNVLQLNVRDLAFECRETPDEHFKNEAADVSQVIIYVRK